MNISTLLRTLVLIMTVFTSANSSALNTENLMMIRAEHSFPEAMSLLQRAIKLQGYRISRVQHIDAGLNAMGFTTDKYRVVFFGKTDQIQQLSRTHPSLIPYLPLKIAIFAEAEDTLLISSNPASLSLLYPDPHLQPLFRQWGQDLQQIFKHVQFSD